MQNPLVISVLCIFGVIIFLFFVSFFRKPRTSWYCEECCPYCGSILRQEIDGIPYRNTKTGTKEKIRGTGLFKDVNVCPYCSNSITRTHRDKG